MSDTPTPSNPVVVTGTTSVFSTATFWSTVSIALATIWQATGWNPGLMDQLNHAIPLLIQFLGALGVLIDHTASAPRKVTLKFSGTKKLALLIAASLTLASLTGCPPVPSTTTQPVSPVSQQLAGEQATLNTIQIAVSIGYDAFTLYITANPNPAEAALAAKAYNATEAAIASAQSHIDAGDAASAQLALADVQAAFQSFLTSTAKAQTALHAKAATLRSH